MIVRLMFIAATGLSLASASGAADPVKSPPRESRESAKAPAELVLASAEVKAPDSAAPSAAPAPAKHRAGRVTTCRCGGDAEPTPDE
ncbi:MAG: hypothetical protein ABIO80_02535 [Sphingomicrobium sp.]